MRNGTTGLSDSASWVSVRVVSISGANCRRSTHQIRPDISNAINGK